MPKNLKNIIIKKATKDRVLLFGTEMNYLLEAEKKNK